LAGFSFNKSPAFFFINENGKSCLVSEKKKFHQHLTSSCIDSLARSIRALQQIMKIRTPKTGDVKIIGRYKIRHISHAPLLILYTQNAYMYEISSQTKLKNKI
jgi:hypothetical protein